MGAYDCDHVECSPNDFRIIIFQKCRIHSWQVDAIGSNYIKYTENTVRAKCGIVVAGFGGIDWWRCGTLLWRIIAQHRWIRLHLADTPILISFPPNEQFFQSSVDVRGSAAAKLQPSTVVHSNTYHIIRTRKWAFHRGRCPHGGENLSVIIPHLLRNSRIRMWISDLMELQFKVEFLQLIL